jgi:hypothetical protein
MRHEEDGFLCAEEEDAYTETIPPYLCESCGASGAFSCFLGTFCASCFDAKYLAPTLTDIRERVENSREVAA